jgi:lysozyme family protein
MSHVATIHIPLEIKHMAQSIYDEALRRLLAHEGGYTNHPSDPGGPTNFGITIVDYRKYVKPGATAADVKAMKLDEASAIYRAKYWDAQRCGELPAGVDYAVFDYGVNSGIGRSGKVLRRVLKLTDNSSIVNDAVVAAARAADAKALVAAICDERLRFLQSLKTWSVFGAGWGRRVWEVRAAALAMTSPKATAPPPASITELPHEQPAASGLFRFLASILFAPFKRT